MEPAGDRPGDVNRGELFTLRYTPQWSRPVIGRATGTWSGRPGGGGKPQWSRPVIGRATCFFGAGLPPVVLPQWSRPVIGRAT